MSLEFEKVMDVTVYCSAPLEIGHTPKGFFRVIPIIGGVFEGPKIKGKVVPGGADWNLAREDGVSEIWARYTLETDDGVLISVINEGTNKHEAANDESKVNKKPIITKPSFLVAGEKYAWLNDHTFVGTLEPNEVEEGISVKLKFYKVG